MGASFFATLCRCKNSVFPVVFLRALMFASLGVVAMYLFENYVSIHKQPSRVGYLFSDR